MKRNSIVEPVSECRTDDQELLEETRDAATDLGGAVLSDVDRCDAGHASNTEASDEAADVDLADMVKRRDLDDGADEENNCKPQERSLATQLVVGIRGKDGAEETTCCEQGNNVLGNVGVCLVGESSGGKRQSKVCFEALK